MKTRQEKIIEIINIIRNWGSFSVADIEADFSPVVNVIGDTAILAERFNVDDVDLTTYVNGYVVGCNSLGYDQLSDSVIDDIYDLAVDYNEMMLNK